MLAHAVPTPRYSKAGYEIRILTQEFKVRGIHSMQITDVRVRKVAKEGKMVPTPRYSKAGYEMCQRF